jgi:hypothetical protein
MQKPQAAAPSLSSIDFASLLASMTVPVKKPVEPWDDCKLADDFATISYEQALRTHGRNRVDAHELPAPPIGTGHENAPAALKQVERSLRPQPIEVSYTSDATVKTCRPPGKDKRAASVMIRLSKAEYAQLRARADEAALTVSAYLRSCIFEAEDLRTQVRQALSQFRSAGLAESAAQKTTASHSSTWRAKLLPQWCLSLRATKGRI